MYNSVQHEPHEFSDPFEAIQHQTLRQDCHHAYVLPEAELILAIINQAYEDTSCHSSAIRREARRWFYTKQFKIYCELVGLNALSIHQKVIQQWSKI